MLATVALGVQSVTTPSTGSTKLAAWAGTRTKPLASVVTTSATMASNDTERRWDEAGVMAQTFGRAVSQVNRCHAAGYAVAAGG